VSEQPNTFDYTASEPAAKEPARFWNEARGSPYTLFSRESHLAALRLDFAGGGRDTGNPCLSIWRSYSNFEIPSRTACNFRARDYVTLVLARPPSPTSFDRMDRVPRTSLHAVTIRETRRA